MIGLKIYLIGRRCYLMVLDVSVIERFLKVLFRIYQSFALLQCFSLWAKHGSQSLCFFVQSVICDFPIG